MKKKIAKTKPDDSKPPDEDLDDGPKTKKRLLLQRRKPSLWS